MNKENHSFKQPGTKEQYYNTDFHCTKAAPTTLWVVHDPFQGPHFFLNKRNAEKMYKRVRKQYVHEKDEDLKKLSKPLKYILDHSKQRHYWKMNRDAVA